MDKLTQAIKLATVAHEDQLDKSGKSYILHPLRVMFLVSLSQPAGDLSLEEEMIAAVLHDTVEDTPLTLASIEMEFGNKVMRVVDALTRRKPEGETYRDFIYRCRVDAVATKIKRADIQDNLSRIAELPESERSISRRYHKAAKVLGGSELIWEEA